jgi:ribosomal protein L37AE/L43A
MSTVATGNDSWSVKNIKHSEGYTVELLSSVNSRVARVDRAMAPEPKCPKCGKVAEPVGELPEIGLRPAVYVYKCVPCGGIVEMLKGRPS